MAEFAMVAVIGGPCCRSLAGPAPFGGPYPSPLPPDVVDNTPLAFGMDPGTLARAWGTPLIMSVAVPRRDLPGFPQSRRPRLFFHKDRSICNSAKADWPLERRLGPHNWMVAMSGIPAHFFPTLPKRSLSTMDEPVVQDIN